MIAAMRETQKDKLLARVASGEAEKVRLELLAKARKSTRSPVVGERTVGRILDHAAEARRES